MEASPWTAPDATGPIIELKGLKKRYGEQMAVSGLNLSVAKGEIFGLLGPNGAGKTTTILMMLGLTEPTEGSVRVCGLDPARSPLTVKRRVGYMPDDVGFYEDRTALDNLLYTARLNRIPLEQARQLADRLLERVGLAEAKHKKVGAFSRGMRQRLGIADVLIKQPDIVILDEPTLGIDPEGVRELLRLIRELSRQDGLTVLLSSHHLHQVQQICDRVGLFVRGELIAQGDVPSLARQLDQDGAVTVELAVGGWNARLAKTLASLPGVKEVRASEAAGTSEETEPADATHLAAASDEEKAGTTFVLLACDRDVASEAAATVVQGGGRLLALKRKQYGLDDIYHRYFEGGARA
ncbi:ABC transporter ATP-binding protein [Paenibacillus aurantiacus]|uniref:ABC transporter ATP-binding protein n=1 Tax=Paenibacillus aurantiacus TaxID=1936118 RepID=A0ABV5KMZ1_9BACL